MTYPLSPPIYASPNQENLTIACHLNDTNSIQNIRIMNGLSCIFEQLVFPGERMVFDAPLDANLQIHSYAHSCYLNAVKLTRIDCSLTQPLDCWMRDSIYKEL